MSAAPPPEQPEELHRPGDGHPPGAGAAGRRRRLIGAFARVAAEHGYSRTTIAQVTEAAGVPEQAFYAHFGDLEDCFLAAYDHGAGILLARMHAARLAQPGWRDALRAGLRVLFEAMAAEPAFARIAVIETGSAGPRVRRARLSTMANFRGFFSGPDMPPIPGTVRDALIGGIYTTIYSYVESDRTAELPELLPAMSFFALLPFVSRDEAAEELLGH
ncbi:TetR/AcrR family transcriptional regulator [Actinomadura scrupuli]|uniref:TetR/AcrR family transcriptional regulator n=1 Tax=Actinomadura scrupuli TaxID=559629 RepID=UPI003D955060